MSWVCIGSPCISLSWASRLVRPCSSHWNEGIVREPAHKAGPWPVPNIPSRKVRHVDTPNVSDVESHALPTGGRCRGKFLLNNNLNKMLANRSVKNWVVNLLCCAGYVVSCNYSTLPPEVKSNGRWYVNKWVWLCSNETLFTKNRHSLPLSDLNDHKLLSLSKSTWTGWWIAWSELHGHPNYVSHWMVLDNPLQFHQKWRVGVCIAQADSDPSPESWR